jgi:dCMP deaminase
MTHNAERNKYAVFMRIAQQLSVLGTCDRKQVGALIVYNGRCVSWGYNGAPPGLPHCSDNNHGWGLNPHPEGSPYYHAVEEGIAEGLFEVGCINATHAEANALAFAACQGISTDGGILFVTVSPCDTCARLLIAAGIVSVYYEEEYRDPAGRVLLEKAGVPCTEVS